MEIFFYLLIGFFQALPFVIVIVLGIFFALFCLGAYNSPTVGVWVGAVLYLLSQMGANGALPLGLNLSLADFYFVLLAFVVGIRTTTGHFFSHGDRIVKLWLFIAAVWGVMFVIGIAKFKTIAGVEFRTSFYTLTTVLYLLSFPLDSQRVAKVFTALYSLGLALALLAVYRWISIAVGDPGSWYDPNGPLRVLDAAATLTIALAMLPGLTMWMGLNAKRTGMMMMAPLLLLVVAVLGHRTVWIASLAALGIGWWLAGRKKGGTRAGLLVPLSIGVMVLAATFVFAPTSTVTQGFEKAVAETQQKKSTLNWRVDSWKSLVDDWIASGPMVWPAGKPFGSGYRRFVETQGMETIASAHSHYVSLLVRGGLLVLGAYLAVHLIAFRRLINHPGETPDWLGSVPVLFVVVVMVYGVSYSPDYQAFVFASLAYVLALRSNSEPVQKPPTVQIAYHARRRLNYLP